MKRFKFSIFLVIFLLLSPTKAFADYEFELDGIYYRPGLGSATVISGKSKYKGNISIPSTVYYRRYSTNSLSVTSIDNSAFYCCTELISIELPYSLERIWGYAFYGCTSLTTINIPNNVTSIHESAFQGCSGLTSIEISNGVTSIEKGVFKGCTGLTNIKIPNSVTSIGESAFQGCTGLTSIEIPNSVTSIGDYAFEGCTGLTSIEIPNSVTKIGRYAFSGIKNVVYSGNATGSPWGAMGVNCFFDGDYIYKDSEKTFLVGYIGHDGNVVIPNETSSIGDKAFYNCTGIQSLTIGSGVTSIGSNAFNLQPAKTIWLCNTVPTGYSQAAGQVNYVSNNNFSKLSNVTVYPYLSSLFEVDGLKYVPVNPAERTCDIIDCTYSMADSVIQIKETVSYKGIAMNVKKIQPYCCYGNDNIKKVTVFPVKTDVSNYSFQNCTGLDSVQVSNDGFIGESAFAGCTNLKTAIVSNNGDIGNSAFYGCKNLKTAILNNNGDIGNYAFQGNTSLQSVQISQANNLGELAFDGCTNLETAVVDIKGGIGQKAFQNCAKMKSIQLGDNVSSVDNYAFYGCKTLEEIVIPNATKSIGTYCFQNCSAMQKAVLGDGIMTVPQYAFAGCAGLQDVTISPNVSTIGQYAFQNCSSLPQIAIPSAVTKISNYAFEGCKGLKNVVINDRKTALTLGSNGSSPLFSNCSLDSVYIGGKISYNTSSNYGYSPFYRNTSLRTIVITDEETKIYDNEFYGCTGLKNVKIGDGVESIGNYAFSGCSSLAGFAFGKSMKSIGKEAFSDCTSLVDLTSKADMPPTCDSQALEDINKWNCTLHVPASHISEYQAANQWKDFFFVEGIDESNALTEVEALTEKSTYYNLQGTQVVAPRPNGLYIRDGKKIILK